MSMPPMSSQPDPSYNDSAIKQLIAQHPVILFMKGNRKQPHCGFSAQVVHILNQHLKDYHTVDILQDEELRSGMKSYSNWPTFPQLYVNNTFIGGCDIVADLEKKQELAPLLTQVS
ncbi:MAG: Grx4 family monothiol glutaredoxin [Proteobacteria bacterium]|nr:Grx4 family monothiol glutaredoxin [Pseudomonadota bacterium]